jgi:hypothetical protein
MARYFASGSVEELNKKAAALLAPEEEDEDGDSPADRIFMNAQLKKDLSKVQFAWENFCTDPDDHRTYREFLGFHTLPNGMPFWGCLAGGDWEIPILFILYLDPSKKLRAYIPERGQYYNKEEKCAFGNQGDETQDVLAVVKHYGLSYDDAKRIVSGADDVDLIEVFAGIMLHITEKEATPKAKVITLRRHPTTAFPKVRLTLKDKKKAGA